MKKIIFAVLLILTAPLAFGQSASYSPGQAQTTGNLSVPYVNSISQADQFAGADFCVKLRAANVYALAHGISLVDATHFTGAQACSVDPLASLETAGTTAALTILFPAAHIDTTVPWTINNNSLSIRGIGAGQTIVDYEGASGASAVLSILGSSTNAYATQFNQISGMSFVGGVSANSGNVTDGLFFETAHRWKLEDVDTWGVTGCGIHTEFAVTPTMIRPRTNKEDAEAFGYYTNRATPTSELCLDENAYGSTTDGTVVDADAEGVSGAGWHLINADSMTFTSGTSEDNGIGAQIDNGSNHNSFISSDFEGHTTEDVLENGNDTHLIGVIAASSRSIQLGSTSEFASISTTAGNVTANSAARMFSFTRGGEVVSPHQQSAAFNGGAVGWNQLGQGDADYYDDVAGSGCAHAFFTYASGTSFNFLGCLTARSQFNAVGGFEYNGTAGITATKTAGSCVFTIQGGIITNVTGC